MTQQQYLNLREEEQQKLKDKFMRIYPKFRWVRFYKWLQYENEIIEESEKEV